MAKNAIRSGFYAVVATGVVTTVAAYSGVADPSVIERSIGSIRQQAEPAIWKIEVSKADPGPSARKVPKVEEPVVPKVSLPVKKPALPVQKASKPLPDATGSVTVGPNLNKSQPVVSGTEPVAKRSKKPAEKVEPFIQKPLAEVERPKVPEPVLVSRAIAKPAVELDAKTEPTEELEIPEKPAKEAAPDTHARLDDAKNTVAVQRAAVGSQPPLKPKLTIEIVAVEGEKLIISGVAETGRSLRVHVNGILFSLARADAGGRFEATRMFKLSPGNHRVRVDMIDRNTGAVVTRARIPFIYQIKREVSRAPVSPDSPALIPDAQVPEPPAKTAVKSLPVSKPEIAPKKIGPVKSEPAVAAPIQTPDPIEKGETILIRPGDTLWQLSRRTYGRGVDYMIIFEANRDTIDDPHMIYSGQVFKMPDSSLK